MVVTSSSILLKSGRDKPVRNRHPWIFSGAIDRIQGDEPEPGDIIEVRSADGHWLARGYYNPHSQITARILSWSQDEEIDEAFWLRKLKSAIEFRSSLRFPPATNAFRLVNAESDGLPGLIVDRYDHYLVVQFLTLGMDRQKKIIIDFLRKLVNVEGIYERSDVPVRKIEKIPKFRGLSWGKSPPNDLMVLENELRFVVNIVDGHKTGLYLDQRDNRQLVADESTIQGKSVLNVFSYTGGFGTYAARASASKIVNIDDSDSALEYAKRNIEINGLNRPDDEYIRGDAFQILRNLMSQGQKFDVVILDPPKFAHNKGQIHSACRGYKDLNLFAMKLLEPNGLLATFSCSGLISRDLFQKVLFGAAIDGGRDVQVLSTLSQPADHPVLLTFPESAYLKGFLCRVI